MSDNPHVQYANAKLRHKKQKSQGFHSDAKHAEREMIRISNLHKIKTGKHINDHAEALVAHHEKAKEIKRQYVQHSTDLIHAKKAGDKERMERAAKGKAQAEKDHLAHTGEPAEEKFVEYKRPIKEGKQMKTFKELYEACCAACEKRADIEEVKEPTGGLKDACWKGYTAVGMKMKNGRKVPNCVPANEEVEFDESYMMSAAAAVHNQPKYKERTPEQEKKHAERKAEKYLHMPGKNAAKKRKYWVKKVNKLHGIPEESQKGKNVVPPQVGALATGGIVKEEENENKPLGKVMRAGDGKKKFKVFVKNSKGNTVKVGFGDPNMEIKRDDPERRKNFRARHNCDTANDRTTPRYWSCRQWRSSAKVEA